MIINKFIPHYNFTKYEQRILFLGSMGALLESYDFYIYMLFSGYFATQFFPNNNVLISLIYTYIIFFIGYIIRPIGAIFFSHIGDAHGRKLVMLITMVIMGISSVGIAILPNYDHVGIYASILLLLLRMLQGLSIGGEFPSIMVYLKETLPANRLGTAIGMMISAGIFGVVFGIIINLILVHFLNLAQLESFGWRIPFLLGGGLCFISYQLRQKLHETNIFQKLQHKNKIPFFDLCSNHMKKVFIGIGLESIGAIAVTMAVFFMPVYLLKIVKLSPYTIGHSMVFAAITSASAIYISGVICDRVNMHKFLAYGVCGMVLSGILCYYMIVTWHSVTIFVIIFAFFQGIVSTTPVIITRLFPTEVCLSGVAFSYNMSVMLFVGLTPLIIVKLIDFSQQLFLVPVIVLIVAGVIGLVSLYFSHQYSETTKGNR
jgi:MFS family permease